MARKIRAMVKAERDALQMFFNDGPGVERLLAYKFYRSGQGVIEDLWPELTATPEYLERLAKAKKEKKDEDYINDPPKWNEQAWEENLVVWLTAKRFKKLKLPWHLPQDVPAAVQTGNADSRLTALEEAVKKLTTRVAELEADAEDDD